MKKFLITGFLALLSTTGFAAMQDIAINEILVRNYDNFEDEYGHRVSWIELYNSGHSSVDISSCYLVIESGGESVSYRIPKNDSRTHIPPQEYTIFFCEGIAFKGTFYTNFTLSMDGKSGSDAVADPATRDTMLASKNIKLSFVDANGNDTISSVYYNLADQLPDVSVGFLPDGEGNMVFGKLTAVTPYATNNTREQIPADELFRQTDPIGYGMAIIAMTVVLTALALLYLVFRTIGKVMIRNAEKKVAKAETGVPPAEVRKMVKETDVFSGGDMAAIALAMYLYDNELQDQESAVLTINRVQKAYSPWSSKLYGMTQAPDRVMRKK